MMLILSRLKSLIEALQDALIIPMTDKIEDWKRITTQIDRTHSKGKTVFLIFSASLTVDFHQGEPEPIGTINVPPIEANFFRRVQARSVRTEEEKHRHIAAT